MSINEPMTFTFKLRSHISRKKWYQIAGMEKWEYGEFICPRKKKRASKRRKRHGETV